MSTRNPVGWHSYEEHFIKGRHFKLLENKNCDRYRVRYRGLGAVKCRWRDLGEFETTGGAFRSILRRCSDHWIERKP